MKISELIKLFEKNSKRYVIAGNKRNGALAGLDLEGRIFCYVNGLVVNRVNVDAINGITDRKGYLNPGGDGLWPAPEGTSLGYEYPTVAWRVPAGLTGAKYKVVSEQKDGVCIAAEVDLINNSGLGIPVIFRRDIRVSSKTAGSTLLTVTESIEYIGKDNLTSRDCRLAPWSLCQFDSSPNAKVIFPLTDASSVWDMYDPSSDRRTIENGICTTKTNGISRYQLGLSPAVPWIEYVYPEKKLKVRRSAGNLPDGQKYIDIIDAPPSVPPSDKQIRYSVYSDASFFMEIEASGGMPDVLTPGTVLSVTVDTEYCVER